MSKPRLVKFGFGIVGPDGKPYWDEGCVCEDKNVLRAEIVSHLNAELAPKERFREVALCWRRAARRTP